MIAAIWLAMELIIYSVLGNEYDGCKLNKVTPPLACLIVYFWKTIRFILEKSDYSILLHAYTR